MQHAHRITSCMRRALRGLPDVATHEQLLGCSLEEAVAYLEDNPQGLKLGQKNVHIDHVVPISYFKRHTDLRKPIYQCMMCWHKNLRLMRARNNASKSDKCSRLVFYEYRLEFLACRPEIPDM